MKSGEKADTVAKYKVGGGGVDSDGEVPDPVHIMAQGEAAVAPTPSTPRSQFSRQLPFPGVHHFHSTPLNCCLIIGVFTRPNTMADI